MKDKLQEFYSDHAMQLAWANFIVEVLNAEALKRVYAGQETEGLRDARKIIDKSFTQLKENFEPKEKRKVGSLAI